MSNYIFVDVEARGISPVNGTMTEFGCVNYRNKATFHGVLYEGTPDPENPAIPIVGEMVNSDLQMAQKLSKWLREQCKNDRPIFVSDNVAYDWMWIAGMFDKAGIDNPFGYSGRRISDFWAGVNLKFSNTQSWKKFRKTPHDHNPVNDAMGNVEAFEKIIDISSKKRHEVIVAGKKIEFFHTAVNKDMHMMIDGYHNPDICPECIQRGILVEDV
jgi:hypothetical protein